MKNWMKANLKDSISDKNDTSLLKKIDWETAHEIKGEDGSSLDIAKIKITDTTIYLNKSKGRLYYLVLIKKNDKIVGAQRYMLYGDLSDLAKSSDLYIKNYSAINNSKYTGIITLENLQGNFVTSNYYNYGVKLLQYSLINNLSSKVVQDIGGKKVNACTDYYLVYRDEYGSEVGREFIYEFCDGDGTGCAQTTISRTGVQSVKLTCGGGATPPITSTSGSVTTNNIKDPCLKNMVDFALKDDVQFNTRETVNSVFNTNLNFNLNFQDAVLDPTLDGEAYPISRTPVLIGPDVTVTQLNTEITLNSGRLQNATREYIAATIIHECFHSYLELTTLGSQQHDLMAQKYLTSMTAALLKMFPSMPPGEANSLCWQGLQADAPDVYSKLSPTQQQQINDDNTAYLNGNKGHQCSGN
jgi:hypothetical protein